MKLTGALPRFLMAIVGVLALLIPAATLAAAQQRAVDANGEPLSITPRRRIALAGAKDVGASGLKSVGFFDRVCVENVTGSFDIDHGPGAAGCGPFFQSMRNGFTAVWPREAAWSWGVPPSDWDTVAVPLLKNAIGGGWTASNINQLGDDDTGPADGSLGFHHSGVTTLNDRSCTDHRTSLSQGVPLLAGIDCPNTWGLEGWKGARPVPAEVYLARYGANPTGFVFDQWRVTDGELDAAGIAPTKTIGNFQAYGFTSDFSAEILCGTNISRNYAHVVPTTSQVVPGGCTGSDPARRRHGWPLGIEVRVDAFSFQLPSLKEISYYQVLFTNKSKLVYGVGLDYDSLYINLHNGWFGNSNIQQNPTSWVLSQGALYTSALPITFRCPGAVITARDVSDIGCASNRWTTLAGFGQGAAALIVLKSPIGDQRNKLFTRTPRGLPCVVGTDPFCNPGHPLAADTFTFNHGHLCGFRRCGNTTWASDPAVTPDHERRGFGMMSSTEANVLGNRTAASLSTSQYWHTFRNFGFTSGVLWAPGQPLSAGGGFNKWAPAMAGINWDYNKDGIQDTLAIDGCFLNGCAALWSDTLPNGKYSAYSNTNGVTGVGPIRLMADSTVSFVVAITTAQSDDSAGFMAQVANAIDNYLNFYLAPDAAPKCKVSGVTRVPNAEGAEIGLNWDNSCFAGQWTDKFLAKQYTDLVAAPAGTPLARLRQLNPRLDDTLLFLSTNNIRRLYLFKSCNDGNSWTTLHNCIEGHPATGGTFADVGFLPYATFDFDGQTPVPNSFTDDVVVPGLTYTYNVIGETRGANFDVLNGDSTFVVSVTLPADTLWGCARNCRVEPLELAPVLFNSLSASTGEVNTGRAYLPVSLQAGGSRSQVAVADSGGPMPSDRVGITVTADSLVAASYKLLVGDSARATQLEYRTGATLDSVRTRLVLRVPASLGDSIVIGGTNLGGLTPSGAASVVTTPSIGVTSRVHTWSTGPVMALPARIQKILPGPTTVTVDSNALLVSNTLTGASATPGAFHGNADYPKFDLSLNKGLSNAFNVQRHLNADGSAVPPLVEPTVVWLQGSALQDTVSSGNQANGDYVVVWGAQPFGSGGAGGSDQFRLDFSNPSATAAAINASINARATIGTAEVTDSVAAAIAVGLGVPGFTKDSLVAARLPFTITNVRYGNRPVLVAMRRRPATGGTILVGDGIDTIRVPVPADAWVPGDGLFFVERINGTGPQALTFRPAVFGCTFTRASCNPVYPGTRGATVYLGQTAGQRTVVRYHTPVTAASNFTLQALAPSRGAALNTNPGAVRSGLAAVRVVPNPYVMLSQYAGNVLLFTHMPPSGVLRIYTVAGQFVQQITWDEDDLRGDGDLSWNLRSREGNLVAGGLYLYVLTATDPSGATVGTRTDKFVIIR